MTPKYDVHSFGMLMLEVLYGWKPTVTSNVNQTELTVAPQWEKMDRESLKLFKELAYKCRDKLVQGPTMDKIVKDLEEILELQWKHENLGHTLAANEGTLYNTLERMEKDFLKVPLSEIKRATNDFNEAYLIGSGGYADVYRAELNVLDIQSLASMKGKRNEELSKIRKTVAIKRINNKADKPGKQGFLTEIELLTGCNHPNIVSLLGFSREAGEMILIYEYAFKGSLGDFLVSSTVNLTWAQRINICLDIAHGISYLHNDTKVKPRIIHRDIKSDNILLDKNMNAKLADFGLSKSHPTNQQPSTIYSKNIAGTELYMDPEYRATGKYKRESDIYSFGVVLFEVLSGRVAYDSIYTNENRMGLAAIARRRFNEGTLKELIDHKMIEEDDDLMFTLNRGPNQDSWDAFSKIASQCLAETQAKRPTIEVIIKELQNALKLQGEPIVLSRFRYSEIESATNKFAETYCIGSDTNCEVYKAELDHFINNSPLAIEGKNSGESSTKSVTVAIIRFTSSQGKQGFFEELEMGISYKHPNICSLLGFCDEGDEKILVYEHASNTSLKDYLGSVDEMHDFTWARRLHMCLEIARGLNHLHTNMDHRHAYSIIKAKIIKSANIFLYPNWESKIAYLRFPELPLANRGKKHHVLDIKISSYKNKKIHIYSFGVVLFEIFCGRVAYDPVYIKENGKGIAPFARQCFNDGTIHRIMDPRLKEKPNKDSLDTFLKIAYQCVEKAADKRPTTETVIEELERALNFHCI